MPRSRSRERRKRSRSGSRGRKKRSRSREKHSRRDKRKRSLSPLGGPADGKTLAAKYGLEEQKKLTKEEQKEVKKDESFKEFQRVMETSKQPVQQQQAVVTPAGKGAAPVSMDSLKKIAQQKAAADEAKLKPVFLGKKEREELALKRLADKREAESKAKNEDEETRREERRRKRREEREKEEEERKKRQEERKKNKEERQKEKELQVLRDSYLGGPNTKKKHIVPPSQKFKFSFDWEPTEDTSQDMRGLYETRKDVALLFGRGFMGGMDRREQRKQNQFWEELIDDRKKDPGFADARDAEKIKKREEREKKKAEEKALASRHWSEKSLEEMEERDWRIFKEDFNISTRGSNVPNPLRYWAEANLPEEIYRTLARVGYKAPTPIQRSAIPIGLQNRDMVGIAETGSGKTAAFLIPLLVFLNSLARLNEQTAQDGPYAIILAPTRELAQQIYEECEKFAVPLAIRSVSIVGGLSIQDQGVLVRKGCEVVIATPGRLFDCIEKHYLVLNQCNYVVLDEADRMIDMNFEPQINRIFEVMPSSNVKPENPEEIDSKKRYRNTIMFSATMPLKVELLARKYLRQPVFVSIGDRRGAAAETVEQRVVWMVEGNKRKKLIDILSTEPPPFIVFMNNKKACDKMGNDLNAMGMRATVIHGGKVQDQRESNLKAFKEGEFDILVGTDVVGRGIDITGVEQVVNYDMPKDIERYTHRIGRTGRAGRKGIATSFLTPQDTHIFFDLKEMLRKSGDAIPAELARHEAAKTKPGTVNQKKSRSGVIYAK